MKRFFQYLALALIVFSCKKEDTFISNETVTAITTTRISNLTLSSAASGGTFVSYGKDSILEKGVCWSTSENPTISNSKTVDGSGSGDFASSMTGLDTMVYYFVRAYATTNSGTVYGNQIKFITSLTPVAVPALTTAPITSVTNTSATCGGTIVSDSGNAVLARGICWSTNQDPTIADSKTTNGTGIGSFTSILSGLTPNIVYYVRAYATNAAGTGYGNEVFFTSTNDTSATPTVTTATAGGISFTSASVGGNVTSQGGSSVIARGVCWATTPNPNISGNITNNGTGLGGFGSSISGLTPGTKYYYRAYATNIAGTAYGTELSFTTTPASLATLTTTAATAVTVNSASTGGNVISDGGAPVTVRGVCWNTSPNPTIANIKTSNGIGTGSFTSALTGLTAAKTYYVRAYATNAAGTAYGNQVTVNTPASSNCGTTVTDIDGNVYGIVEIGSQCWTKQNLKVTRYNNGDTIPNLANNSQWSTEDSGAYSAHSNNAANASIYGYLYNWYTVKDSRKVCPAGWHVPSDAELATLVNFLGGESVAGKKLKEAGNAHWINVLYPGDNSSGFTALPGGIRDANGDFINTPVSGLGYGGFWWSSTVSNVSYSKQMTMNVYGDDATINGVNPGHNYGLSIRCVKN